MLTHTPRTTGWAGDKMGTCLQGKVPRCLRGVGFLPPAEKAGAWPKTSRELGSSAEPVGQELMAVGGQLDLWGGTQGSLQGHALETTGQAGAASLWLALSAWQVWAWGHRCRISRPVIL